MDYQTKKLFRFIKRNFKESKKGTSINRLKEEFQISYNEVNIICNYLLTHKRIELEKGTQSFYIPSNAQLHPFSNFCDQLIQYLLHNWIAIAALIISLFAYFK